MGAPNEISMPPAPFIVGSGRCGSTLLRLMLDAHPELAIPPETHFIPQLYEKCESGGAKAAECFIDCIASSKYWPDFHIEIEVLRRRIKCNSDFDLSESLRDFYMVYANRFDKRRWGDKTPGYWADMCLIQRILPEAHFIHLIRDGRDTALSVVKDHWGPTSISNAAEWWVLCIRRARAQAIHLNHYMEVHYENLVVDSEKTLKQICEFIELPWNERMLNYHRSASKRLDELEPIDSPEMKLTKQDRQGHFHLTKKPPTKSRIGVWRKEMSDEEVLAFESVAGPLLHELGYATSIDLSANVFQTPWVERLDNGIMLIKSYVPKASRMILLDQEEWGVEGELNGRLCNKFLEKDGIYWGPPVDDNQGISELERQRECGAEFFVFAWPAFWMMENFPRFCSYLHVNYRCLIATEDVQIYDLRTGSD